jgi:hypothetical protein
MFANNNGYGTLTYPNSSAICRAVVIPVELRSFSAVCSSEAVVLQWTTASERNCAGFEVQRSRNTGDWHVVGFVPGNGTTGAEHAYSFRDPLSLELAACAPLRYRLRILETDGTSLETPVLEVTLPTAATGVVLHSPYPQPVAHRISIHVTLPETAEVELAIYSLLGREVLPLHRGRSLQAGEHIFSSNTSDLQSGLYLVVLRVHGQTRMQTIVVEK